MVGLQYLAAHKELAENEADEFVQHPDQLT